MITYLLIRHGETGIKENSQDPTDGLSQQGEDQVLRLAEVLKKYRIDLVYTSPYQRAVESADIISKHCNLETVKDERLVEIPLWINPYELHDDTSEEYVDALGLLTESEKNIVKFLHDSHLNHSNQTIALVCHGNLIRAIVGFVLKMGLESIVRLNVSNASLSVVDWDDNLPESFYRLNSFNNTSHL